VISPPAKPNTRYVGDITYLPVGDGQFLYLATVFNLCSKRLVGLSLADHMRTDLVTDALQAASAARGGDGLSRAVFHSDNGAIYGHVMSRCSATSASWCQLSECDSGTTTQSLNVFPSHGSKSSAPGISIAV
jgi:transposase InsO family protein